jgi:ankyrin repeat protein
MNAMFLRLIIFLTFVLGSSLSTTAQDAKQALNDKLYEATRVGNLAEVKSLLDQGADVNAKFRYGATALFKAAERGHTEVVKLLLERGADVSVKDTFYGATAMTWALDNERVDIVGLLLEKDASSAGEVLTAGVRGGSPELVRMALAKGGVKPATLTAALVAATEGDKKNAEIAEMLKKAGAVPPPVIDLATLESYTGKYRTDQGPEITVSLKDGKLFGAQTGQPPFAWSAIDKTTFRPVDFEGLTFVFSIEAGKVTGFALKQGTNTTQFKRVEESK